MVFNDTFTGSSLKLNGVTTLGNPSALVWGPDGRLYVTEVTGAVKVLTVAFGAVPTAPGSGNFFYVADAVTLGSVKAIQNYNDDGTTSSSTVRQVTGIDVTRQFNATGQQIFIDPGGMLTTDDDGGANPPAVTMYVTSSDSRIGAGGTGADVGLDTNSGIITKLTQTGPDSWEAVDIVRGLPRSEENHATNGLEVIQKLDGSGNLLSERLIVASGGNTNTGAPSNNFAGQQEDALSAAILEVDLDAIKALPVLTDALTSRKYVLDLPTLDDPTRAGTAENDPFGGNDGRNSAKLDYASIVTIYSSGYRNSYDVEVTEDGRVWTYDNGANNGWGARPIGEAGANGGGGQTGVQDTVDFAQLPGYIATNLNNGSNNSGDDINLRQWAPANNDQLHEITRSDDLNGRTLSVGGFGAVTTYVGPDGKTFVYGGHPNPIRASGALAGLLFSPGAGTDNAYLLVSSQNSYGTDGGLNPSNLSDYARVIAFLQGVEDDNVNFPTNGLFGAGSGDPSVANDGDLTKKVLSVVPGLVYDIYSFTDGSGAAVIAGAAAPAGGTLLGQSGLPADIAQIVNFRNPIEGDYKEGGLTDGALDSAKGSINGLAEYTSTIFDSLPGSKNSGALLAVSLNGSVIIAMGRNSDGTMTSVQSLGGAKAADRKTIDVSGAAGALGLATLGDDYLQRNLSQAFQGSIWVASLYSSSIQIFQPGNPDELSLLPANFYAGADVALPSDGIGVTKDPFVFRDAENGFAIAPGEKITLDFNPQGGATNPKFIGTLGNTGLLGAALDGPGSANGALFQAGVPFHQAGATPNTDAKTGLFLNDAGDNLPPAEQSDGLYDAAGNIIPGGNAPILQIKKVVPGTMIGPANTVRDALHTGIRPSTEVDRIVMTITMKNWISGSSVAADQLTGMVFGDGTQSNFLRMVFGEVNDAPGIEIGYEINDANYTVLAQLGLPTLTAIANDQIDLRLEIDKSEGFAVRALYRLAPAENLATTAFTEIALNGGSGFMLPSGVLQDVLTGNHTISDLASTAPSGAAVGVVAETSPGNILAGIDVLNIDIEAFANEIRATTASQVGLPGTDGLDVILYTGTEVDLAPLAANVEDFDGSGSAANWIVTGNALANTFTLGSGANTVTTGTGTDKVVGSLATVNGLKITDFTIDDAVVITDASIVQSNAATYAAVPGGGAQVRIGGSTIIFSGPDFASFDPANGPSTFGFKQSPAGLSLTLDPLEFVLYRIKAGNTQAAIDAGPAWIGDNTLNATTGSVRISGQSGTYSNSATDQQSEIDYANVNPAIVPWQVFVTERGNNNLTYNFDVQQGLDYKIELYYTENWPGIFQSVARIFDVSVEGSIPAAFNDISPFEDINPADGIEDFVGLPVPTLNSDPSAGQFLGVARMRTTTYRAADNELTLQFKNVSQNAKINGIQITQIGGPLPDFSTPKIVSITIENPTGIQDGTRKLTVILHDDVGFDGADFAGLNGSELSFSGIVPASVSIPVITIGGGGKDATLVYTLEPPADGGSWPTAVGEVTVAAGAYRDASGKFSEQTSGSFLSTPNGTPALITATGDIAIEGGTTTVTFSRTGPTTEAVTVNFSLGFGSNNRADATDVGTPTPASTVIIDVNQTTATVSIPIINDLQSEDAENFSVVIDSVTSATGNVLIAPGGGVATVTIKASDQPIQAPGTVFLDLDFETPGDPLDEGGFDGALGGPGAIVPADAVIRDGSLVVQTADGDLKAGGTSSKNDFVKTLDLSNTNLKQIYVTSRLSNPFTKEVLGAGVTAVPRFAQQGIVVGTGTQNFNELLKLVWGGVAGGSTGIQFWSNPPVGGVGISTAIPLTAMVPGSTVHDIDQIELSIALDRTGAVITAAPWVTLFDRIGAVIGGVRPTPIPGFLTSAPQAVPAALNTVLQSNAAKVGVTSNDLGSFASFEAAWEFLTITASQLLPSATLTGDTSASEGGIANYSVSLDFSPSSQVQVTVNLTAGSIDPASIPADAVLTSGGTQAILTFAAGANGAALTKTFSVTIVDDTLPELPETFNVAISSSTATITGSGSITTTIAANDPIPSATLTGDTSASEGGIANYSVSLDVSPSSQVQVTVNLTAGSIDPASIPADAVLTSGGTQAILTFAAGATGAALTKTFSVTIVDDTLPELDETFNVAISSATATITGSGSITTTIAANDAIGAALLEITVDKSGVQSSNFGDNSFKITNTGGKNIAKVEIDVTNALYPDTVFDPFGKAGDTATKPLTINTAGSTGIVSPNNNMNDPLNQTYIGTGGIKGYEGIRLVFDPSVSGGFNPGEMIGFAIDMDPNSIAGSSKSILDGGAVPAWDVGGVSGAELIGSRFTVTFTDGTTATGQLQGTGGQAGSRGLAAQDSPELPVFLTVNGLGAGGVGTYTVGGPTVIVNGPAGKTARIVLTKGIIQPVNNNFTGSYGAQLQAQLDALAASDFPANNAAFFQTVDVLLTGSAQNISSSFNFSSVPSFVLATDEAKLPLGFVASLIDPANQSLPIGPVTQPIYLKFNADPIAVDDAVTVDERSSLNGNVLTNNGSGADSDPDGDSPLIVTAVNGVPGSVGIPTTLPSGALLSLNALGNFTYNPNGKFNALNAGESGTDTFTYTISDGRGGFDTATVTITITGVSDPTIIQAESIASLPGGSVSVYRKESNLVASGGSMLSLVGGATETGTAKFTFGGVTARYKVEIGTFDENDGAPAASLSVAQNGNSIGTVVLDQDPGGNGASLATKVTRLVSNEVMLINGATITVTGVESGGEHARFDFISFTPLSAPLPTISIYAGSGGAEPATPGQFTVGLSSGVATPTTVNYSVSGTATAGIDYTALSGSVTIPAGLQSATITVSVIDDTLIDPNETVIVTLTGVTSGNTNVVVGSTNSATITISDNESTPLQTVTLEAESADTIINYRQESIGVASGGKVLSFLGGSSGESGSAAFVFGDSPAERPGLFDIIIGTFDENDGQASFSLTLTDFETGATTQLGSQILLNGQRGSNLANAATFVTPTVATGIELTAGDIITVNGFEQAGEHARLDFLRLVPTL